MSKQTEALKLIDLLVKQDILTKHETNLLREALAQSRSDEEQPASKPWVGLTVDELESGSQIEKAKSGAAIDLSTAFWAGARWAEAKLREKNA